MLRVGLIGESLATVDEESTALYMGSGSLEVYATPALVTLMESAAVIAIDPELSEGFTTVGIEINVRHLSATPVGERVVAMAEVTRVEGRRVTLEVRAWDERELIGEGVHTRYVINIEQFMDRLERVDEDDY
ncbi:MAG: thioesterase family protein [Aggregatilineales bacterium]